MTGYLYRHIRLDTNEVFYIGVSCNANYKRAYSKTHRNQFWENIVKKTEKTSLVFLDEWLR